MTRNPFLSGIADIQKDLMVLKIREQKYLCEALGMCEKRIFTLDPIQVGCEYRIKLQPKDIDPVYGFVREVRLNNKSEIVFELEDDLGDPLTINDPDLFEAGEVASLALFIYQNLIWRHSNL